MLHWLMAAHMMTFPPQWAGKYIRPLKLQYLVRAEADNTAWHKISAPNWAAFSSKPMNSCPKSMWSECLEERDNSQMEKKLLQIDTKTCEGKLFQPCPKEEMLGGNKRNRGQGELWVQPNIELSTRAQTLPRQSVHTHVHTLHTGSQVHWYTLLYVCVRVHRHTHRFLSQSELDNSSVPSSAPFFGTDNNVPPAVRDHVLVA